MGFTSFEERDRHPQEVVAVGGDEDPRLSGREAKLIIVRKAAPADLVNGENVHSKSPGDRRDLRVEVLIQVEPHSSGLATEGPSERKLLPDPFRSPLRFAL